MALVVPSRERDFTSFGNDVVLYANGTRIESYVPGGRRLKLSGTSMASPQVVNTVGKMLAMNPKLTVAALVAVLKETADPLPGQPGRLIIDPKRAVERATERATSSR